MFRGNNMFLSSVYSLAWQSFGLATMERPMHHLALRFIAKPEPTDKILEIGAGVIPFHMLYTFSSRKNCTIIDSSYLSGVVHKALGYKFIRQSVTSSERINLPSGSFDHIFANNILFKKGKNNNKVSFQSEIKRLLKPNGSFWHSFTIPFFGLPERLFENWYSSFQIGIKNRYTTGCMLFPMFIFTPLLLKLIYTFGGNESTIPLVYAGFATSGYVLSFVTRTVQFVKEQKNEKG